MTKQLNNPDSKVVLPCLLVPIQSKNLILPNVNIAEVISMIEPVPVEHSPSWFLGFFNWRGEQIPLISFEKISKMMDYKNARTTRIAVINSTGLVEGSDFFALVIQGIPRMVRISVDDVEQSGPGSTSTEIMEVKTVAGNAVIPDLKYLESRIREFLNRDQS